MAKMHTCVSESNTCKCSSEKHLRLSLMVIWIADSAWKVLDSASQCLQREDIRDWVCTLVSGAVDGVLWTGNALVVWDCCPGFKGVAEHVESRRGVHGGRHGTGVQWIAYAEGRLEGAMRNTSLGLCRREIEDGGAGCLRSGSGSSWDSNKWLQWLIDWEAFAEWCVDEVEEVVLGVTEVEVHELGGVDDGATADGEEGVWCVWAGEFDGFLDTVSTVSIGLY